MSSAPWSDKGEKDTALVSDDEFMILDSEVVSPATKNKRVKLSNVQANVVTDIDVNGFSLFDLVEPTDPQDAVTKNYVDTGTAIWTKTDTNIFPTTLTDRVGLGLSAPEATLHVRSLAVTGDITVDGDSDDLFIENQGNVGYTSPPTVTIGDPPDTVTAAGTAVLATGVKRVNVTNNGSGYSFAIVTIADPPSGTTATATASVSGGQVQSITVTNRGTGYTTEPGVVITGDGENAAADTELTSFVTSITITNSGSGYADIPTITIDEAEGGEPVDAEATAVLVNTEVTTINIDVEGQDYTEAPAVSFTPPPTKETATAVVDDIVDEKVVSVLVTNGGMGYKVPPSVVTFDGGGGNGVGVDTVTVANSEITSITVTNGGAGLTIVSEPDQVGVIAFTTGGTTTTTEKILFDHSTERMRFIIDSVQGLIIDNLGHVAISQDNVTHAEVFTVDTDVLNVPVRTLIRDSIDRLMLGYNGSDNFVTDAIQAQVIVQTDSPDLSIASSGAEASNLRFYTSDVSGLVERMIITNEGRVGVNVVDPLRIFQIGDQANTSTGIMRFAHNTGSNFRSWDVGTGEIATFGANDTFGIIDVTDPATAVFVIRAGTGNVGLGITVPTVKLHVVGTTGVKFEGGALDMTTQQITDVVNPTADQDAATKNYVDNVSGIGVQAQDLDMGTNRINNVVNPSSDQDAATKNYVDGIALGLSWREPVILATTTSDGNIVLGTGGLLTIDSVVTGTDDRVLVKNQTDPVENGIYIAAVGAWVRSSDMADASDAEGAAMFVSEGTVNEGDSFVQNQVPATVGTNGLIFVQITGLNPISLDDLTDVTIAGDTTDDLLVSDSNGAWVNRQGVFDGITGLGIQTEQLVMGQNSIGNCGVIQFTTGAEETALQFGSNNIGFDSSDQFIFAYSAVTFYSFSETEANFLSHNLLMGGAYFELTEIATPGTPVASDGRLYVKDDGTNSALFFKSDSGVEFNLLVPTVALDELTDVTITTEATNDLLEFNGSLWVNKSGVFSGITGLGLQSQNLAMNSNSIVSLGVIQFNSGEDKLQFTGAIAIDVVSDVVRFTSSAGTTINYGFGLTDADFHDNNIIDVGLVQFNDADTTLDQSGSDLQYDVVTGGLHQFRINDVSELEIANTTINAPTATFQENGTNISPIGRQSYYTPANIMYVPATAGANEIIVDESNVSYPAVAFPNTGGIANAYYSWSPPTEWDPTVAITVQMYWTSSNGTIGNDVEFDIQVNSYSDDDPLDVAFPAVVTITDTLGTAVDDLMISAESAALTLGGTTAAKGDILIFRVTRNGANDTLAGIARLLGMKIFYTTDASNSV